MQLAYEHNQSLDSVQEMLDLAGGDRRTAFRIWLVVEDQSVTALAENIGMSQPGLSAALANETIRVATHAKLVAAGVPTHLLPPAQDVPRGPKRKPRKPEGAPDGMETTAN